jgi:hypothetical protein
MVGVLYHTGRVLPWRERKAITLFKVVESQLVGKLAHGVISPKPAVEIVNRHASVRILFTVANF